MALIAGNSRRRQKTGASRRPSLRLPKAGIGGTTPPAEFMLIEGSRLRAASIQGRLRGSAFDFPQMNAEQQKKGWHQCGKAPRGNPPGEASRAASRQTRQRRRYQREKRPKRADSLRTGFSNMPLSLRQRHHSAAFEQDSTPRRRRCRRSRYGRIPFAHATPPDINAMPPSSLKFSPAFVDAISAVSAHIRLRFCHYTNMFFHGRDASSPSRGRIYR
jgi:hypothetical protein